MKRWMMVPLALLVIIAVAGCGGGGSTTKVTVNGRVADKDSLPLKGATISLGNGTTTSNADGTFSLSAPPGPATLAVSKSGFFTHTLQVAVTAPGPVTLGDIRLTQDIPGWGGGFQDGAVTIPAVINSTGSTEVLLPSGTSNYYAMLFPRTSTAGFYDYSMAVDFTGGAYAFTSAARPAASARQVALVPDGSTREVGTGALEPNWVILSDPQVQTDLRMRQIERDMVVRRTAILEHLARASRGMIRAAVGDTRVFKKWSFSTKAYVTVTATLRKMGTYADWYVDNNAAVNDAILASWVDWFDSVRSQLNSVFGNELDIDGNGKVIVLLSPLGPRVLGFFDPAQEDLQKDNPNSNQAEMIYIEPAPSDPSGIPGTLAHEYQHLLHFSERFLNGTGLNDAWLTEAFSMLAEDVVNKGYLSGNQSAIGHVDTWLEKHRYWSLIEWKEDDPGYGSYGGAYLFGRYLYDKYGAAKILQINRSPYGGTRSVTDAVGGTFSDVYQAWLIALGNRHQGLTSPDPRLNYGPDFHIVTNPANPYSGYVYGWNMIYPNDSTLTSASASRLRAWGIELFFIRGQDPNNQSAPAASGNAKATLTLSGNPSGDLGMAVVKIR